jgi:hypothetical protein
MAWVAAVTINAKDGFALLGNTLKGFSISTRESNSYSMAGPNEHGDGHHRESHVSNPSRRQRLGVFSSKAMVWTDKGVGRQ